MASGTWDLGAPGLAYRQRRLPLGDGDRAQVDPAGQVDDGSGVAKGDGHVDVVHGGVDRPEGGSALAVLGCGEGAAHQQRAVHVLRLRCRDLGLAVYSRGVGCCTWLLYGTTATIRSIVIYGQALPTKLHGAIRGADPLARRVMSSR